MANEQAGPIVVRQLVHRYGERVALNRLELSVAPGELLAVLGPNGSGKTTLFRILSTLIPPQSGLVAFGGFQLPRDADAVRGNLGVVFQHPSLDKKLTVEENLLCQGALYGLHGNLLRERIAECTGSLGVSDRMSERVEKLSGGLKRRVELAKALIHRPSVLLLDEPSTGLDPASRIDLWNYIARLRASTQMTVLFTTHLLDEADKADRVAILSAGSLVCLDSPARLRAELGEERLVIECDAPDVLLERLRARYDWNIRSLDQLVMVDSADAIKRIPELLQEFGGEIRNITVGRPTLEDVFIHRTGHRFWV